VLPAAREQNDHILHESFKQYNIQFENWKTSIIFPAVENYINQQLNSLKTAHEQEMQNLRDEHARHLKTVVTAILTEYRQKVGAMAVRKSITVTYTPTATKDVWSSLQQLPSELSKDLYKYEGKVAI
jgi:hypothetical protein